MERPYANRNLGSYYNKSSKSIPSSRHNKPSRLRCASGWWFLLQEFGSNLNVIMVVTTMCIMMAGAGVSHPGSTAAATRIGDNSQASNSNNAPNGHHHNGHGGDRENGESGSSRNNNGHNPYHHHHQYREHVHPEISETASPHHNNYGNSGGSTSRTNPFAYWTSVTHHYNSYITHPNYHYSSSSSGSPYNYDNGHTYTFGILLNSENEASTALFLNASTPATPADKHKSGSESSGSSNSTGSVRPSSKYTLFQQILIAWGATCLGLLTVVGNILVMISFKIDKQLQTISNYFLFSLAVADFLIGTVGMPLSTVYLLAGYWPFGKPIFLFPSHKELPHYRHCFL